MYEWLNMIKENYSFWGEQKMWRPIIKTYSLLSLDFQPFKFALLRIVVGCICNNIVRLPPP